MQFLTKAVALESAIVEICKQFNVDVNAIKTKAGCPDADALPSKFPPVDGGLVKQYTDLFISLVG